MMKIEKELKAGLEIMVKPPLNGHKLIKIIKRMI